MAENLQPATAVTTAGQATLSALRHQRLFGFGGSPTEVSEAIVGLHATNPTGPYLSLRARIDGFARPDLDQEMFESWSMGRIRAMRGTMFVLPLDLIEIAGSATRPLIRSLTDRWLSDSGLTHRDFETHAARIEDELRSEPLTVRQLRQRLDVESTVDVSGIVGRMCDLGVLIGGAAPTGWRSPFRRFHRWQDVLGDVRLDRFDEDAALAELLGRYVDAYGPVTLTDMSWWSGMSKARCRKALDVLEPGVEAVTVDGWPGPLVQRSGRDESTSGNGGVAVLPVLDPYVQGYKDRVRLVSDARNPYVYDAGGNATATVLVDGRIVGVWQTADKPHPSVHYHLFETLPRSTRAEAERHLADAGSMVFDHNVDVTHVGSMEPLRGRINRSASHPLDGTPHRPER